MNETQTDSPVDSLVSLRWSSEPPTIPGWYWYKDHHNVERIGQVFAHPTHLDTMSMPESTFMGWRYISVKNMGRLWAGPLSPPAN